MSWRVVSLVICSKEPIVLAKDCGVSISPVISDCRMPPRPFPLAISLQLCGPSGDDPAGDGAQNEHQGDEDEGGRPRLVVKHSVWSQGVAEDNYRHGGEGIVD